MDSDDLVYGEEDARTITAASLALGEDESGLVETLDNLSTYGGRRLRTNKLASGSLGRRGCLGFSSGDLTGALQFCRIVIQAQD